MGLDALVTLTEKIAEMSASDVFYTISLLLVLFSVFFEITPIKFNPISSLIRWLGNAFNGRILNEIAPLKKTIGEIRDTVDDNEIDRIRWEILDFSNSCRQGKRHTLDEFVHIIELNEKYHQILKRRNLTNGRIDLEYSYIISIYEECQKKNSFL